MKPASAQEERSLRPAWLSLLAVALGVGAGLGAVGFRKLIAFFHDVLLRGHFSFAYDTLTHTPSSPWGIGVALIPALVAFLIVFLIKRYAPEAKGHGVPEVMDALYYKRGVIRPMAGAVKAVVSALSIGSGGSVGREGPIIQIGASLGSLLGRRIRVTEWQQLTLVAAGGGAGIAATFNTPMGGVLFATEVLLVEYSVRTLVPVALATATATMVAHYLLGPQASFPISPIGITGAPFIEVALAFSGLGFITGLVSAAFIKSLYGMEDWLARLLKNEYLRHALGMLVVGTIMVVLMKTRGHYYVEGVGYATVMDVLTGTLRATWMLLVLFALKLLVTVLTLGSGASGGIFSPSLFMGSTVGAAYGALLCFIVPGFHLSPAALAIAGMAGVIAGSAAAPITALVMIFEMTRDYSIVLPMTLTVAISHGLRPHLVRESIYSMKPARKGHTMPDALRVNAYAARRLRELSFAPIAVLAPDDEPSAFDAVAELPPYAVIRQGDKLVGVVSRAWISMHQQRAHAARTVGDLATNRFVELPETDSLMDALSALKHADASLAVITARDPPVRGVLTRRHLDRWLANRMTLFAD